MPTKWKACSVNTTKTICNDFKIEITYSAIAHQSKSTYLEVIIPVQTPKNYAEPSTCLFIIEHAKEVTLHKKTATTKNKRIDRVYSMITAARDDWLFGEN